MIRVFDAFSGIDGFRSAFERVGGFKTVGWCEIDKFAQKSYRALYDTGGEQFYENIRTINTGGLADFDLLVGEFPCQPFFAAGKRKSFADERGDGNEVQCAGFVIEIFENEKSTVPLDRISAAVDFELLELSMVEATPHGVGRWHEVPEGTAPVRWSSL